MSLDSAIIFIFCISICRLKYYNKLASADRKKQYFNTEDYTALIPSIPIDKSLYSGNPVILSSLIQNQIQDVIAQTLITDERLPEKDARDISRIASIDFGFSD